MATLTTTESAGLIPSWDGGRQLLTRDGWSRDRLLAHQRGELGALIDHVVSSSPYYRDLLGREALAPDVRLEDLPTLSKSTLMEQFDRVVTDSRLRLAALETHASSPEPGSLFAGEYHVFCTSGTTGRRGLFPGSAAEWRRWLAAAWRMRLRVGLGPDARVIGIAAPTPLHVTQKLFAALRGFGDGRPRLTAMCPLSELVETLNRDQPEALFTIPSLVAVLAEQQLEGTLSIQPRRVVVSGEVLTAEMIKRIAEAWGTEPFQVYASTEALILGSESPERVGLHVSEDLIVLEVVDEHDRPVQPGLPGYKVLVTSLVGRALPLIRYELADSVTLASGPDPSGRPYMRIERIDGRNDDALRLPAARGGECVVLPQRLRAPFASLPDVLAYQIVQEARRLVVRVVLHPEAAADALRRVAARVRAALAEAGAAPPVIEVEQVAEIEREPGGAKVKLVKRA
jgi:phenylacetate-CoA ligase